MKLKDKALSKVGVLWIVSFSIFLLVCIGVYYVYPIKQNDNYLAVVLKSALIPLLVLLFLSILFFLLTASRDFYLLMLDYEAIKDMSYDSLEDLDKLRAVVKFVYRADPKYGSKSFTVISSSLFSILILLFSFFIFAYIFDFICPTDGVAYCLTLLLWTTIFIVYFYVFKNRFLTTSSREIYIYIYFCLYFLYFHYL